MGEVSEAELRARVRQLIDEVDSSDRVAFRCVKSIITSNCDV